MKKELSILCFIMMMVFVCTLTEASALELYVDAAPNVYGSPDYPAWEDAAFEASADGSFVNMASGVNPDNVGTTNFEIEDEVVYSFGDLGSRLTWLYWIPDETVANLTDNDLITVSLFNIWDGDTLDFYEYYYGETWLEPSRLFDYDSDGDSTTDGVIGMAGMAWWGAYEDNTQEALDADLASWGQAEEDWIFTVNLDGEEYSITSHRDPVPEPSTWILLSCGLMGLIAIRKKQLNK